MSDARKAIIYFVRNDLRFHDNECLKWANSNCNFLLPIFCFDPRQFGRTSKYDFPKCGKFRLRFLLETLSDLRNTLRSKNSDLVIRMGLPEQVIPAIVESLGKHNVDYVVYQKETTKEELEVENNLKSNLNGVPVRTFWGATVFHKDDLPFPAGRLPDVFTEFRKQVERSSQVRALLDMPEELKPLPPNIDPGSVPSMTEMGSEEFTTHPNSSFPFCGGETHGLARVDDYFWTTNRVATYKETRNGLMGPDYSTKFAPWLANGSVSPRQIYWELRRYEDERAGNDSTYWVIFELLWRDYFRFVSLKYGACLFWPSGIRGKKVEWSYDKKAFEAWKEGRTGVPFVDANMREIAATGFMSNRGRQNVASFLAKDLGLDWRFGAEWFESLLIDYDVCSNYGNWQYVVGIGNDPREDRKFNMIKQAKDYDPDGQYARLWLPELSKIKGVQVHMPWMLSLGVLANAQVIFGETYPKPILVAPEWNRHPKQSGSSRVTQKPHQRNNPGKSRGIDFYFKHK